MSIHIVTLNTKGSQNPFATLAFMKDTIRESGPSPVVFGLQELDRHAARSEYMDVPSYLADRKDFRFAKAIDLDPFSALFRKYENAPQAPWEYGIGIVASDCTIKEYNAVPLGPEEKVFWDSAAPSSNPLPEYEPRVAIVAKIQIDSHSLWIANIHLAHTPDRESPSVFREAQIKTLLSAIERLVPAKEPCVVMGDFNATPNNSDLKPFDGLFEKVPVAEPTKATKNGKAQVDHILYRHAHLQSFAVRPTSFSDHSAVMATFDFVR